MIDTIVRSIFKRDSESKGGGVGFSYYSQHLKTNKIVNLLDFQHSRMKRVKNHFSFVRYTVIILNVKDTMLICKIIL